VSCQEVLAVGIVEISADDAAACDRDVVRGVGVQEDRVVHFAAETNRVVQLNQLTVLGRGLAIHHRAFRGGHGLLLLFLWELL